MSGSGVRARFPTPRAARPTRPPWEEDVPSGRGLCRYVVRDTVGLQARFLRDRSRRLLPGADGPSFRESSNEYGLERGQHRNVADHR